MKKYPTLSIPSSYRYIFSIAFSDNSCIECIFPANNPVPNAREVYVSSPLSPLIDNSFWNRHILRHLNLNNDSPSRLIQSVNSIYDLWQENILDETNRVNVSYTSPKNYFIQGLKREGVLSSGAGLYQIKDYAKEKEIQEIQTEIGIMDELKKEVKDEFFLLLEEHGYFKYDYPLRKKPAIPSDKFHEKRLSLVSYLIDKIPKDKFLTRVKLSKAIYLCDTISESDLKTKYKREVAGPLDANLFYNSKNGINVLGKSYKAFVIEEQNKKNSDEIFFKYKPSKNTNFYSENVKKIFKKSDIKIFDRVINFIGPMDTRQSEIVVTLFACWNDFLLSNKIPSEDDIIESFYKWSPQKKKHRGKT